MKKILCVSLFGLLAITAKSQSVGVGTTTPHTSAALDISSTSKGLLIPRMTTAQRDSIAAPLAGLQILNLNDYCVDIYDGTYWIKNCGVKITGTDTVAPLWSPKSAFGGGVRTDAVAFTIGTKGYMGTGFDGSYKKDFWEYDPDTDTWSQKADLLGNPRRGAIGFSIGDFGYIGTGFNGNFLSDMYRYTPGSNSWVVRASMPGGGRTEAFCFATGSGAIAGTGENAFDELDDVWEYLPGSNSWNSLPDFPLPAYSLTAFVANGLGYVGIGWMEDLPWPFGLGSAPNNKLYKWEGGWIQVATMPGNGRYNATGIGLGTKGYVSTGREFAAIYYDDSWSYDAVANTWTQLADIGGQGRASACGFAVEGKVYLGTGNNSGTNLSDFYELDLFPIGMEYSAPDLPGPILSLKENLWTKDNGTLYSNYTGTPGIAITDAGKVGIGMIAPNASLQFANLIQNKKIVLYEDANNDHQYYGLGINASTLRYQVDNTASSHVFYAATGASSSSELMRIRGNGTVGIGTSSPAASAALDVSSTTKGVLIPRMTTVQRTAIATPATGLLVFDITTNSFWFRGTSAWVELIDNLDIEVFRNGPAKIYMALTDSVGIGTNNPAYKLDVKTVINNYGISHTDGVRQIATWVGDGGEIGTVSNHSFRLFANNGLKQFTLLPNGNIGINISSDPVNRFDIAHGAARSGSHATGRPLYVTGTLSDASNGVEIRDADGTQGIGIGRNTVYAAGSLTDQNIGLAGKGTLGSVLITTNGAERVRVSGAGNVGIGNTAPHAPLHFANSTANRKIVLYEQANNDHQYYGFGLNGNILRYQVDGTVSDHVFYAAVNATTSNELARIKGNGNLSIAGSIITEAFIEPTLLNGFTNYGADHATAAYYKDKSGRVFLKGLVNNVSNPTGLVVFNLPVGYRPSTTGRLIFTTLSNGSLARVDITASGDVLVFSGTTGWVSMDNISFRAD
jgi:N-acetylneuraminic acid mutarotase